MAEELNHKACVNLLIDEYGVPKQFRQEIVDEVQRIWHPIRMPHFVIIRSIRGFVPMGATVALECLLERYKTHPPKHKKGSPEYRPGENRETKEPDYEHQ